MPEQLPDFTDEDATRRWLEGKSPQYCRCIASRAALRSLPAVLVEWSRLPENPALCDLTITILRAALISSIAPQPAPSESKARKDMHAALSAAAVAAARTRYAAADAAVLAARSALGGFSAAHPAARAIFESVRARGSVLPQTTLFSLEADAIELADIIPPKTVFSRPLWSNMQTPKDWSKAILSFEITSDPAWTWWAKWYRQMFDGTFADWTLAEEIALLPEKDWDQGPEHIARKIEIIEARRALERQIAELKVQLDVAAVAQVPAPQRNHNNPPELIGDVVENYRRDIVLIRNELAAAEEELAQPEPSPSRLKAIAQALWRISRRMAIYCGTVVNVTIKSAATAFGAVAGTAGAAKLLQPDSIASVAEKLAGFAKLLGG